MDVRTQIKGRKDWGVGRRTHDFAEDVARNHSIKRRKSVYRVGTKSQQTRVRFCRRRKRPLPQEIFEIQR